MKVMGKDEIVQGKITENKKVKDEILGPLNS